MPRPRAEYLRADVKVSLPAPLAAEINLYLEDPLTHRRKYGALSRLVEALLSDWLARQRGGESTTAIPSIDDLREGLDV